MEATGVASEWGVDGARPLSALPGWPSSIHAGAPSDSGQQNSAVTQVDAQSREKLPCAIYAIEIWGLLVITA